LNWLLRVAAVLVGAIYTEPAGDAKRIVRIALTPYV